jgi:hypothetical protein
MVRRSDDTWCLAEVIHRRENQDTDQEEYYVHYENFNRCFILNTYTNSSVIGSYVVQFCGSGMFYPESGSENLSIPDPNIFSSRTRILREKRD